MGSANSTAAVVLLQEARVCRERATKARSVARQLTDSGSIERLGAFADELEARARETEMRAERLSAQIARARELSDEIETEVAKARARVEALLKLSAKRSPP